MTTGNEFKDCFNDGVDELARHLIEVFKDCNQDDTATVIKNIAEVIKVIANETKMKEETMGAHPIKPKRRPANKKTSHKTSHKPKKKKK